MFVTVKILYLYENLYMTGFITRNKDIFVEKVQNNIYQQKYKYESTIKEIKKFEHLLMIDWN